MAFTWWLLGNILHFRLLWFSGKSPLDSSFFLLLPFQRQSSARAIQFACRGCYWSHSRDHPLFATQETLQKEQNAKPTARAKSSQDPPYVQLLAGAISREQGNEPGDSLKGNHRGWFIRVIPSFPAEHQQGFPPIGALVWWFGGSVVVFQLPYARTSGLDPSSIHQSKHKRYLIYVSGFLQTICMQPKCNAALEGGSSSCTGYYFYPRGQPCRVRIPAWRLFGGSNMSDFPQR